MKDDELDFSLKDLVIEISPGARFSKLPMTFQVQKLV